MPPYSKKDGETGSIAGIAITLLILWILVAFIYAQWRAATADPGIEKHEPPAAQQSFVGIIRQRAAPAPGDDSVIRTKARVTFTGYCPGACCCGKFADGKTATGTAARYGVAAIGPDSIFQIGDRIEVPGYGMAVVEDRGGGLGRNQVDLCFPSHEMALDWGRRYGMAVIERRKP